MCLSLCMFVLHIQRAFKSLLQSKKKKKAVNDNCGRFSPKLLFIILSLKLECEKLASEKMEIQRHYVMVIEDALP